MTELSGAISALIGGGLALSGVFLNNWWSQKRFIAQISHEDALKIKEHKLSHAEDLYGLVDEWQKVIFNIHMQATRLAVGDIDYVTYVRLPANIAREDFRFYRIQMIISAYFPELEKDYAKAISLRDIANERRISIEKYAEQKITQNDMAYKGAKKLFFKAQDDVHAACDGLKSEIVKVIRQL